MRPITTAWRGLGRDSQAVAALEFALLLPLLLILYVAGAEVGQAIAIYRKVSLTSYTLADLVSQYSNVCSTSNSNSAQVGSLPDLLSISTSVMLPYPVSNTNMVVAGITNTSGSNKVNWSYGLHATAWTTNAAPPSSVTISSGLFSSSSSQVIVAQTQYTYKSAFAIVMKDIWGSSAQITLSSTSFVRPRQTSSIGITSC